MPDALARLQQIIWIAMLGAQVVYVGLGLTVYAGQPRQTTDIPLLPILAAAAVVLAVLAVILRGRLASFGPASGGDPRLELQARMRAEILPWALDETIGVLGFVLMMFGYRPLLWIPFCGLSIAMLLLHAPRAANEA